MDEKQTAAFETWFDNWRRSTWHPLSSDTRKEMPPHWNINAKAHMEIAWLACYQHLAPQLMDVQRLDWMLEKSAFMVWTKRDGSILQCQAYTQDEDEEYHVLSGEHRYFNTPREAIDAAREQEKKTC